MTVYVIIIVIFLLIIFQIILWKYRPHAHKKIFKVVKAGDVTKPTSLTIELSGLTRRQFVIDGNFVEADNYEIFIVDGESMSQKNIHTGDAVFIKKLHSSEKYKIQNFPILLLEIDNPGVCGMEEQPEYKLRRFISYMEPELDFNTWFARTGSLSQELKDARTQIELKYNQCLSRYAGEFEIQPQTLIFSSTFDIKKQQVSYSFHPVRCLYGVVEYILPKEKI